MFPWWPSASPRSHLHTLPQAQHGTQSTLLPVYRPTPAPVFHPSALATSSFPFPLTWIWATVPAISNLPTSTFCLSEEPGPTSHLGRASSGPGSSPTSPRGSTTTKACRGTERPQPFQPGLALGLWLPLLATRLWQPCEPQGSRTTGQESTTLPSISRSNIDLSLCARTQQALSLPLGNVWWWEISFKFPWRLSFHKEVQFGTNRPVFGIWKKSCLENNYFLCILAGLYLRVSHA